jgi:hypothetical protein
MRRWLPGAAAGGSVLSSADYGASATPGARKVLVMQSAFLGDSLLTFAALRRLKEILPGAW